MAALSRPRTTVSDTPLSYVSYTSPYRMATQGEAQKTGMDDRTVNFSQDRSTTSLAVLDKRCRSPLPLPPVTPFAFPILSRISFSVITFFWLSSSSAYSQAIWKNSAVSFDSTASWPLVKNCIWLSLLLCSTWAFWIPTDFFLNLRRFCVRPLLFYDSLALWRSSVRSPFLGL